MERWDVAIVGAGIAGLSLAWHLQRAGKRVVVLEQSAKAQGASVRNFGMIWVVGQPAGELRNMAIRSRELWEEAADDLEFWIRRSGSLTLAYDDIETQVLQEFLAESDAANGRSFLAPDEVQSAFPFVHPSGLKGGLLSESEAGVDPREVVHAAADALASRGVDIRFNTRVSNIESGRIEVSGGEEILTEKTIVCPGPLLHDLYPMEYRRAGLLQTRLQMLRLKPKNDNVLPLGIHLCAGLTLGHYANFQNCPSLPALLEFHRTKWPRQMEAGIHVLVAEHADGTLTVGDSHHGGRDLPPYRSEETDEAILEAMNEFLLRDQYDVVQRWDGTYNTHPTLPYWWKMVGDNIWALNLFGTGMTLSFGLTERIAKEII